MEETWPCRGGALLRRPAPSRGKRGQAEPRPSLWQAPIATARSPAASPYWLGVEVFTVSPALRTQLGLADREGLVVEAMPPGSPAEKAGVKLYDVLVKAGGKKSKTSATLWPP